MKLGSKVALLGALTIGLSVVPAMAKEKPAPQPAGQALSKEFRAVALPVQTAVNASAWADALAKIDAADAAAKTPYEKFVAAKLRYDAARGAKDTAMEERAIDLMLASGGAPEGIAAQLNLGAGQSAYRVGNYTRAIQLLQEAQRLGNKSSDVLLLLAEASFKTNQVPAGLNFVKQAIATQEATGAKAPKEWYARAASFAYKSKLGPETAEWTRAQVRAYPTAENWRTALAIYRDGASRDAAINLDIFRLMRTTKSMAGERDYFEYAALAFERGLPGEAKSVIDEGFATSAVPASSRPLTELRAAAGGKVTADRQSLGASERSAAASPNGKSALATADAYLGYGDEAKAIPLYKLALSKGGVDADTVNTHLGIALTRSRQLDAAKAAFATVTGARAEIAKFWLLYIEQQGAVAPAA